MPVPWPILAFFLAHWWSSVFFQSFFQHRYAAHRMFRMSPRWERCFQLWTYLAQGSSYLNPRAYAILHRMHHAYADTERDPHSPVYTPNPVKMMSRTAAAYHQILHGTREIEPRFAKDTVSWPALDRVTAGWVSPFVWGAAYTVYYAVFATAWWQYLLLPIHYVMGPVHGTIVNYFGHLLGYRTFGTRDHSRNTLPIDVLTMGELLQNNHHARAMSARFASRRFEFDPAWPAIWLLDKLGIIELAPAAHPRASPPTVPDGEPSY